MTTDYAMKNVALWVLRLDSEGRPEVELGLPVEEVVAFAERVTADIENAPDELLVQVNLPSLVDFVIDGHVADGVVDIAAKPRLDALRAELVAMIATIDHVQYSSAVTH